MDCHASRSALARNDGLLVKIHKFRKFFQKIFIKVAKTTARVAGLC